MFSIGAHAQAVNATVLGTVNDTSGAVVPNANVSITEAGTGFTRTTTTNSSGNYVFPNLPPGVYGVEVQAPGFKKEDRPGLQVQVNSSVRADLTMQPGNVTETIEVTAATPVLQTERADVSQKIDSGQLEQLPIGGANRNFQNLLALVPGTVRPHRDHSDFFNAQDTLSSEVNGQSREFNQLAIEGVNDDERTGLLQIYVPPAEAIQTVDVTTSNYSAEFGRAGGAVTNVILKSGTNAFHGSLYEFNRISALQARPYFQRTGSLARSTFNYYGGTIGGPIIKDKTFFFFDLLRIDDIRGQFQNGALPTDAFRNGDVTAAITSTKQANIYDPFTGNPDGTGRQQIFASSAPGVATIQGRNGPVDAYNPACKAGTCKNIIPLALMDPISLKILALVPHSTSQVLGNNYQQNTQFRKNSTSFDSKIDHNFSEKDRLAFRFSRAVQNPFQQPIFGAAGGFANGGFQGQGDQHEQSGAINETHIFSSSLIMETRAGISHYRNIALTADHGTTATTALGIPGANLNAFTSGLTQIEIGGFANPFVGYSASQPWDRGETNINLVNSWTKISGNHTFKWGADIRRLRDDLVQAQTFGPRGHFFFGTGTTLLNGGTGSATVANDFAAFLLDAPSGIGRNPAVGRDVSLVSGSWRETEAFFFGQDTWHATNKLTLDMGLRWELYVPATPSRAGRYSNYDPTTNRLVIAGIDGNPSNLGRETYYKYFAPRLGVAYRANEQTVIRAGFGISYEPFTNNQYAFNFPIRQNQGSTSTNSFALSTFNGPATLANGFPAPSVVAIAPDGTVSPNPGDPYNVIDKHFQEPYVESYNLSVQRSLPAGFVLDLAYVGNHGVKIPVSFDLNAATTPALTATGGIAPSCPFQPLCAKFGRTATTAFLFKPTVSNYNSLQAKFDRKWKSGFMMTTAYTWAKALAYRSDMNSDDGGPDNYLDFQRNYTVTSRSRTHTFVQSYVYELPFGKNKHFLNSGTASWLLGGWGVSSVLTRMSGAPLHITDSTTLLSAPGSSSQYPNLVAPFRVLGNINSGFWFDPTSFAHVTTPGVLGNLKRYQFSGPAFFNLDAAVFRNIPIGERMGFELRAEAFSVTNTPHFNNPDTSFTSPTFGKITGTGSVNSQNVGDGNRVLELSAKFSF